MLTVTINSFTATVPSPLQSLAQGWSVCVGVAVGERPSDVVVGVGVPGVGLGVRVRVAVCVAGTVDGTV
jgi:hypothetical protein